jgi:hypothetical protein
MKISASIVSTLFFDHYMTVTLQEISYRECDRQHRNTHLVSSYILTIGFRVLITKYPADFFAGAMPPTVRCWNIHWVRYPWLIRLSFGGRLAPETGSVKLHAARHRLRSIKMSVAESRVGLPPLARKTEPHKLPVRNKGGNLE